MRTSLAASAATLALLLSACGASGSQEESSATTDAPTTTEAETTTTEEPTTTTESNVPDGAIAVEEWAEDFCGNFEGWLGNIQDASTSVGEDIQPGDIQGGKDAIVGLFESASAETETLITGIEDGGVPDVEDGDALVDDLLGRFDDFNVAIEEAKAGAENLPVDDPATFQTEVTSLTDTFETEVTTVGESFAELDAQYPSRELQSALSDSCSSI